MSLPRAFRTEVASIPQACPYLQAQPVSAAANGASRLKVGIVWQGSLTNDRGRFRSCTLADLAPLRDISGISLYSLQSQLSGDARDELLELSIPDLETGLVDFADTAAVVQSLDLVITVDTAMAHLAGALGRPVWVLLSAFPDWRWLLDRDDSPWYPTMRLFRQQHIGDWASVVSDVTAALVGVSARGGVR